MLALKCNKGQIEKTREAQTIFDVIYNTTGEHDLAMLCFSRSGAMKPNDKIDIQIGNIKIKLVCYNEEISKIDDDLNIIMLDTLSKFDKEKVEETIEKLKTAIEKRKLTSLITYDTGVWQLAVDYAPLLGIQYLVKFKLDNGEEGASKIYIDSETKEVKSKVEIPRPVKNIVLQIDENLENLISNKYW